MTTWKPMTKAPRDGTVIFVMERDDPTETGFYQWKYDRWSGTERFTSIDPDGNYSIPEEMLGAFVFTTDITPPNKES